MKCNRSFDDEDKQCPHCGVGVPTFSLNSKEDWQRRPKRFPRVQKKIWNPGPETLTIPGEYKAPPTKIFPGGQIESKRPKH